MREKEKLLVSKYYNNFQQDVCDDCGEKCNEKLVMYGQMLQTDRRIDEQL